MAVASDALAANTKGLVQQGNKVSRKRLALWFKKRGRALDSPPKRQARRFSGAIHTPGLLRGVMDGSAEAAPENAAQHKRGG